MSESAPRSVRSEAAEIVSTVGTALLIALVLRVLLFQPFTIPSSSMEPGLVTGDYIIVSKFSYGWSYASVPLLPPMGEGRLLGSGPARGDVLVFHLPGRPAKDLIKRVVGLPGDRVQVREGAVYVNGQPIPRRVIGPGLDHDSPDQPVTAIVETTGRTYVTFDRGSGGPGDDTDTYVVPEGSYFMMGDNRDNSLDSRWPREADGVGFVPARDIVGKAQIVLMSWKPGASLFKPWTWLNLNPERFFKPIV